MNTIKIPIFIISVLFSEKIFATQCLYTNQILFQPENMLEKQIEIVDFIFVGEAIYAEHTIIQQKGSEEYHKGSSVIFAISETIKGSLPKDVMVKSDHLSACDCAYKFTAGVTYLVLGMGSKEMKTIFCDLIRPFEYSQHKEIVEIINKKQ